MSCVMLLSYLVIVAEYVKSKCINEKYILFQSNSRYHRKNNSINKMTI